MNPCTLPLSVLCCSQSLPRQPELSVTKDISDDVDCIASLFGFAVRAVPDGVAWHYIEQILASAISGIANPGLASAIAQIPQRLVQRTVFEAIERVSEEEASPLCRAVLSWVNWPATEGCKWCWVSSLT